MREFLIDLLMLTAYYAVMATVAVTIRKLLSVPDEIFRKFLHFILIGSFILFAFVFKTWWIACLVAISFAVLVYPILMLLERVNGFSRFVTERKKGELKKSLLLVFGTFAVVICVCRGIFHDDYLAAASVYAWGIGDAFAALIGKKYGKRKITLKGCDGKKSVEGSLSMFIVSALSVLVVMICRGNFSIWGYFITPLVTGAVSSIVELFAKNGNDTVFCPLASMAVLLPLFYIFQGAL